MTTQEPHPAQDAPISVFDYLDYREFLRDWLSEARRSYGFSFRIFSRRSGFGSPSIYKLVMDGERNLTEKSIKKFVKGLKLEKTEADYFRHLVLFNQAKFHIQKDKHYRNLICLRDAKRLHPIATDQYEYYSTWYHPIVREMVVSREYDGTPDWIAQRIQPAISSAQVRNSLELLERLEFIQKGQDKTSPRWRQSTPLVTSGDEGYSIPLFNYHRSVLDLIKERLSEIEWKKRDISTLTLGISRGRLKEIKQKIQEFRREILNLVASDTEPDEVVLLSMQLLPVATNDIEAKEINQL